MTAPSWFLLDISHAEHNITISEYHMPVTQLSNPRKRRHSERLTPSRHISKRQKRSHPPGSQLPSAFWDNLSKIDLTKRAVEELDRRNTQAALSCGPPFLQSHRPITRSVRKESSKPLAPPVDYLYHCGTSGLKKIKLTARRGGPDLSDLRGLPAPSSLPKPTMSSSRSHSRVSKRKSKSTSRSRPSTNTTNTASTGPYNRNFQQNLVDGGVYPHAYRYPDGRVAAKPDNWEEIHQRLSRPRPSLSPSKFSEEAYEKFVQADADASKEKQVTTSVIPIIEGDIKDAKCVSGGIPFTNLDHLTDGTLVPGNPDIYYGARPEQLHRRVRDELSGYIIPSTQDDLPIAPNFFLAAKGPDGSAAVAKRQASYDGALGARGIRSLQSYSQKILSDNNAYTITSTYHDATLKMFTSHPTQPTSPGSRPAYSMHQLRSFAMADTSETFRHGATFYRNGRDWAKEQRDEAISRANKKVDEDRAATLATDISFSHASSFATEAISDEMRTIEALTEDSRPSLTDESSTTTKLQTTEASSGVPSPDYRASVKRSSARSSGVPQSRQKRFNAGNSDYDLSKPSELEPLEHSGLSQQFENQDFRQEPGSYLIDIELRPIAPDTSAQPERPGPEKKSSDI